VIGRKLRKSSRAAARVQVSRSMPTATPTTGSIRTATNTAEVPGEEESGGAVCVGVWVGRRDRSCESVAAALRGCGRDQRGAGLGHAQTASCLACDDDRRFRCLAAAVEQALICGRGCVNSLYFSATFWRF
jgi:hypothetical protein